MRQKQLHLVPEESVLDINTAPELTHWCGLELAEPEPRELPAWARRLAAHAWNKTLSFKDLTDIYTYLRSIRDLINKKLQLNHELMRIFRQINHVMSPDGFASVPEIRDLVGDLIAHGLGPEIPYQNKKLELGLLKKRDFRKEESPEEKKAKGYLQQGAQMNRANNWQWRLQVAIKQAIQAGWYPLFGTYTVDPKRLPEGCLDRDSLWRETPAWDRFVKKFKTEIAEACNLGRRPANWPPGHTFMQYFAVLEHGKSSEHPHVHVVWLCRDIPKLWKRDPNTNCPTNTNTDIVPASALWKWGIQRRTMGLFIVGSPFVKKHQLDWEIPIKPDGTPTKVGDAGAVAAYVAKYLTKHGDTKKWNHRVKATKNIGLHKILETLENQKSNSLLLALACRPPTYQTWMRIQAATSCPLSLLRQKSQKVLLKRLHTTKTRRAASFLQKHLTKTPPEFFTNLMLTVKDGVKPWKMLPEQRYNSYTRILEEVPFTVHSERRIQQLIDWLEREEGKITSCDKFTLLKGNHAI